MKLATYKKNHQGFFDRQIKEFASFPSKEDCLKMGLVVAYPMANDKIELHKTGKYNPLLHLDEDNDGNY